ncbi:MAG: hypothetical protein HQL44_09885 [Alphaproteobacteria bacterium]|nr:hypothetical protein [Alphaproteobacteria bacterium]CAA6606320.1 hypothetical protein MTBLM1_80236 [Rhodospirillaceae bacterium LM-1]
MPKAKASKENRVSRQRLLPKPSSGFMSISQVVEEFGFSASFLNHLPEDRRTKYHIGKIYYERAEIIAAIKSHRLAIPAKRRSTGGKRGRGRPRKPVIPENETANPL